MMRDDGPPTPEEREKALRMFYENVGRNGGPAWEQLDDSQRQYWSDQVDNIDRMIRLRMAGAERSARYALPMDQLQGEPDGAMLINGKRYAVKGDHLYGPEERDLN